MTSSLNSLTLSSPGKELVNLQEETKNAQHHTLLSLCLSDLPYLRKDVIWSTVAPCLARKAYSPARQAYGGSS